MKQTHFITFIVSELYYIPIYEPVANEARNRQLKPLFLVRQEYSHRNTNTKDLAIDYLSKKGYECRILEDDLSDIKSKFVVFSANGYKTYDFEYTHTILMSHGIGTKGGYFSEEHTKFDIRFVEGSFRKKKMEELFPNLKTQLFDVGFAKLDPAINLTNTEKENLIKHYGLSTTKKTILYSPTFYPSTIERIKKNFPKDFQAYNIIIKPHAFSYEMTRYKKHRKLMQYWEKFPNVYVAPINEFNLTPFMAIADLMLTDESSAMFEFVALNKPMICYRDVKLRWTYRLFKNKLKKRMEPELESFRDSFENAYSYSELCAKAEAALLDPNKNNTIRQELTRQLVGQTDGKVSQRIIDILSQFTK